MIRTRLNIDGMEIPFEAEGVNGRASVRAFRLMEKLDKVHYRFSEETIDETLEFIVDLFGGQFTKDEFLDGCEGSLFVLGPALLNAVIQDVAGSISEIPARPTTAAAGN